jgi:L-arabinokinase
LPVFFYVSGHGFGHAIRQIEIINTLAAREPRLLIAVRTSAPRWLFQRTVRAPIQFLEGEVDTGVVQIDGLRLDEAETIARAEAFYKDIARRAGEEAALLRQHRARLVVSDAPPLACAAAARAGIPAIVCANFTWDWIYAAYAEHLRSAPDLLPAVRDAYAQASAGWRMPMHGGFESVPAVEDIPFVARQPRRDLQRAEIRRALGLPLDARLALVSFGGYGAEGLPLDRLDSTPEWTVIVTHRGTAPPPPVLGVDEAAMYSAGLRYEDLVGAVDAVISKPGYGIISDCVAAGTPLLYTSRGRFAEYDVLVAEMPRYLRCRYIDGIDLRAGRWRTALDSVIALPVPPEAPRTDGAAVVAQRILELIRLATND